MCIVFVVVVGTKGTKRGVYVCMYVYVDDVFVIERKDTMNARHVCVDVNLSRR